MKQVRTFKLLPSGLLNYYKDKVLQKGSIKLTKDTKVIKGGKDRFEIQIPGRTYYLSETESGKFVVDKWIEKIREVQ